MRRAVQVTRGQAIYGLVILALTVFLNALDQMILPAVAADVQTEFHLSDAAVGSLFGAFVIALALGAVPLGYLADHRRRRTIIAIGLAVWSGATVLSGLALSFAQMLAARALVGIGEASSQPAGTSILADYFSVRGRGRAMAVVIAAAGLGTGGGLIVGGALGHHFGWRPAFYVAGIPGLLVAALVLTIREPPRGAAERVGPLLAPTAGITPSAYIRLLHNRTYLLVLVSGTFGLFSQGTSQLVTLYLHRRFGLDIQHASALVGSPLLIGGVLGTPFYGWLIDVRTRRTPRGAIEVALAATILCALASAVMFGASSITVFTAGAVVFGIVQWAFILVPFVIVQNVVAPPLRASATAATVLSGRLLGSALGPVLVGMLSDRLGGKLGTSLLVLSPTALLASAACLVLALWTVGSDMRAMEEGWSELATEVDPASRVRLDAATAP